MINKEYHIRKLMERASYFIIAAAIILGDKRKRR
jgi:hypothetical protein